MIRFRQGLRRCEDPSDHRLFQAHQKECPTHHCPTYVLSEQERKDEARELIRARLPNVLNALEAHAASEESADELLDIIATDLATQLDQAEQRILAEIREYGLEVYNLDDLCSST